MNERIWLGIKKRIREKGFIWERRRGFFQITEGRLLERCLLEKDVFWREV